MKRRDVLASLGACGIAGAFSGRTAGHSFTRTRPIVGVLLPRSGYLAGAGDRCFAGARLAQQLLPALGYPAIEIVAGDTGEDLDSAKVAATRLMQSGVNLLIGCFDSGQTVEVAALAEQHRIPLVINMAAAPTITQMGYRFVFRNFPDAVRIVKDSYRLQQELFATTGFAPRKLVVMHIDNGRGIELIQELYPTAKVPYEKPAMVAYDPKSDDLSAPVAHARATGADALWLVSRLADAIRITREAVRQQWVLSTLMSSNAGLQDPQFREALGQYSDYALTFAPFYNPLTPLSRRLQRLQETSYPGVPLGTEQVYTFEAVMVAANAFKHARSTNPLRVAAALRATSIAETVTGPAIQFDSHGQNTALGLTAIQNQSGQPRIVWPPPAAETRAVLPMPPWRDRPTHDS